MHERTAFVLMPFSRDFDDLYQNGIKKACEDLGILCERADEKLVLEEIVPRVYAEIASASIVIAEVSDRNPNVYYEVGYAHALQKQVVLLIRNIHDAPFDLRGFYHVIYGGDVPLLRERLGRTLSQWLGSAPAPLEFSKDAFPWPHLLRNAQVLLDLSIRKVFELQESGRLSEVSAELLKISTAVGARHSPEFQVSVLDADRVLLHHDHEPFIGTAAIHRDFNGNNFYDEVMRHDSGAVAWADKISNEHVALRARLNIAIFARVPASPLRVVVETHHELR